MSKDRFIVLIFSLHETSLFSPQHFVRSIGELPRGEGPETELGPSETPDIDKNHVSHCPGIMERQVSKNYLA